MGEIPLLTRENEISLARKIELARMAFRRKMLESDYCARNAVDILEQVRDGTLSFDRTMRISTAENLVRSVIRKRLPANLETVNKLLKHNRIEFPKKCFHKYLHSHVDGFYLDLAASEWATAILLPTEDFVKDVNGHAFPYPKEDVWKEVNDSYYDSIKAQRVIEGYGKASSKQMVK